MENPVDHTLDLGLVNYVQHPENKKYIVFRFADEHRAAFFEKKLMDQSIWFEKGEEMKKTTLFRLFAIHGSDFKTVEKINFETEANFKKPLIPTKWLRYSLLLFSTFVMTLTLMGYCNKQKQLEESTRNTAQVFHTEASENK